MPLRTIDFSRYSALHIGPICEVVIIEALGEETDCHVIGHANNLLLSPTPPNLAILGKPFEGIEDCGNSLRVGAALPSGRLFSYAKKQDLAGFEFMGKLPGSIGGMVWMNAGMKQYEIANILLGIETAKGFVPSEALGLEYRKSAITETIYFAHFKKERGFSLQRLQECDTMRSRQPKEASCGSCFKNPHGDYAGRLLESVGLKGYGIGGAAFSEVHANFLINRGGATYEDAITLIECAKQRVFEQHGIALECEVQIL